MKRTRQFNGKVKVHPATITLLTDATWAFAHSVLWGNAPFNKSDTAVAKMLIAEYYEAIPAEVFSHTAHRHFSSYCERVVMARDYVLRSPYRYIPHPCIWLDRRNPTGFVGTKTWYDRRYRVIQHPVFRYATAPFSNYPFSA